jgi:hypothetical protein
LRASCCAAGCSARHVTRAADADRAPASADSVARRTSQPAAAFRPSCAATLGKASRAPGPAHHRAHEAGQGQRGVLPGVHAGVVQVADVDLDAGVVLGRDQAVGPRALARDVQVNVLAWRGGASDAAAGRNGEQRARRSAAGRPTAVCSSRVQRAFRSSSAASDARSHDAPSSFIILDC